MNGEDERCGGRSNTFQWHTQLLNYAGDVVRCFCVMLKGICGSCDNSLFGILCNQLGKIWTVGTMMAKKKVSSETWQYFTFWKMKLKIEDQKRDTPEFTAK